MPGHTTSVGRIVEFIDRVDPLAVTLFMQRGWVDVKRFYRELKVWPNRVNEVAKWMYGYVRFRLPSSSYPRVGVDRLFYQTLPAVVAAYALLVYSGFDYGRAAEVLEERLGGVYRREHGLVSILNTGRYMLDFAIDRSIALKGAKHKVLIGVDALGSKIIDGHVARLLYQATRCEISDKVVKSVRITKDVDDIIAEYLSRCPFTITLCLKAAYLVGLFIEGLLPETRPEYRYIEEAARLAGF